MNQEGLSRVCDDSPFSVCLRTLQNYIGNRLSRGETKKKGGEIQSVNYCHSCKDYVEGFV